MIRSRSLLTAGLTMMLTLVSGIALAEDNKEKKDHVTKLAGGKYEVLAPGDWKVKKPRVRIIEHEFSIPPAEGDENEARLTIMNAGGSIEANIQRWVGQFSQQDGGSTAERTKSEETTVAGCTVHIVDISGTFADRRGPFAPAVKRPKYRMLAAIVETKNVGNYFFKLVGPQKTMAANEEKFKKMIGSLEAK